MEEINNMANQDPTKRAIRDWWAAYPMTYGDDHGSVTFVQPDGRQVVAQIGSAEFFTLADKRFYEWNVPRHDETGYFGKIFDYKSYKGKPILEVGCGLGCMAMNWAKHGALVTAIDLNPVSVYQTRRRFELFRFVGDIREADAEELPFKNETFEYVYSWGVLHHTPGIQQAISEIHRVLSPGGEIGIMLYHRHSLLHKFVTEYIEGYLHLEDKFSNPLKLASRYGDGAREEGNPYTWPVTIHEVRKKLFKDFHQIKVQVFGTDLIPIFDQWFPGLGSKLPRPLLEACARRWGWSLWITAQK
jgi:ubiquinone/menaquinone biosynthesis C-methylase UbiE